MLQKTDTAAVSHKLMNNAEGQAKTNYRKAEAKLLHGIMQLMN